MDISRLLIGLSLAVVTYLLILQWNEDYEGAGNRPATVQQQTTSPAVVVPEDAPPVVAPETAQPAAEVPIAGAPPALRPVTTPQAGRYVAIETRTYRATIDLLGGDLVDAALHKYPLHLDTPDEPFPMLSKQKDTLYVVQSGLVGPDGADARPSGRPMYRAGKKQYSLVPGADKLDVDLQWQDPDTGVVVVKRYTFHANSYRISVSTKVENTGTRPWTGNFYGQIKRNNHADPSSSTASSMSMSTYLGAAFFTPEKPYVKIDFSDMDDAAEERADRLAFRETVPGGWVAFLQHYFVSAWVPAPDQPNAYYARRGAENTYLVGFTSPSRVIKPGEQGKFDATLYIGPKIQQTLGELSPGLELTIDYGWLWFLAQPIFWLLSFLHGFAGNWGVAIILVTLTIKLAFFQLSAASYRSMANMRRIQPELVRLKELHGEDRQKMSQEMMELYKREKINPLGGCLPIMVQIPVFIALYWVLLESVELRHAPFFLWIQDLSVKDPYFVLPIAMGLTMFLQQQLNPAPPDPTQAMVLKILPVLFTFFFLWFPSGLVLYWLVNNILSITQQWIITRNIEQAAKPRTA